MTNDPFAKRGDICNFCWGSHGCDLPAGDHTVHLCANVDEPCCEYDETADQSERVRHYDEDDGWRSWGPCGDGWHQEAIGGKP